MGNEEYNDNMITTDNILMNIVYIGKKEIYTNNKLVIIKKNKITEYISFVLDYLDLIIYDNNLSDEFESFMRHLKLFKLIIINKTIQ